MKLHKIEIENIRAIKKVTISGLRNTVLIAGPNGCGKSSIFDALRLIKSFYGQYQGDELNQWFSEFQINQDELHFHLDLPRLFKDRTRKIFIGIEIVLSKEEKDYILKNKELLINKIEYGNTYRSLERYNGVSVARNIKSYRTDIKKVLKKTCAEVETILSKEKIVGSLTISPDLKFECIDNIVLSIIFSNYNPTTLGIIDYHGPNRNYSREKLGGINFDIQSEEQKMSQNALYNYNNKYSNIKSEMAAAYVRELIMAKSGKVVVENTLIPTLKELFATFFPDKEFMGPIAKSDGTLYFPVRMSNGEEHDIDELSSGEKEVLYGYLRIRNNTPKNSIILIDEPELHLNPGLIRGFPQFYNKYFGELLGNQIILVTHSDALLREAVGQNDFSIYHMQLASKSMNSENQASTISADDKLNLALIDLVGDLATYYPGLKTVLFEGGGDTEFDVHMTLSLFPELKNHINAISAQNKERVKGLQAVLKKIVQEGKFAIKVFSIVDRDSDISNSTQDEISGKYTWGVYHIENYLLNSKYILEVLCDIKLAGQTLSTEKEVSEKLLHCAEKQLEHLVKQELYKWVNDKIVRCINLNEKLDVKRILSTKYYDGLLNSIKNLEEIAKLDLSSENIQKKQVEFEDSLKKSLSNDNWRNDFKGRDILKSFTTLYGEGVKYEIFRNMIINKMVKDKFKPEGMKNIVDKIIKT